MQVGMHSDTVSMRRLLKQFWFTSFEVLLLVVANGVIILAAFLSLIAENSAGVSTFARYVRADVFANVLHFFDRTLTAMTASLATTLLWAIVGSFVYFIVTGARTFFSDSIYTLKSTFLYVHPQGFNLGRVVKQMVIERLVSIGTLFITVLYAAALSDLVIPYVFFEMKRLLVHIHWGSAWIIGYLFIYTFALHVVIVLLRLEMRKYRYETIKDKDELGLS